MTDATVASAQTIKPTAYSVPEFAETLGISTAYAWVLVQEKRIKSIKLGKRRLDPPPRSTGCWARLREAMTKSKTPAAGKAAGVESRNASEQRKIASTPNPAHDHRLERRRTANRRGGAQVAEGVEMSVSRNARRLARRHENSTPGTLSHGKATQRHIGMAGWHLRVLRQCGAPPHDRAVAAAHEAGHAVIALTLGGRPGPVTVSAPQPGVWTGWTTFQWPPEQKSGEVHPLECPWEARHAMVVAISGYQGEDAAGMAHPASSPDEVFPVVAGCTAVAEHFGLEAGALVAGVMKEAADRIGSNRALFDAIRQALATSDRVTAGQIDELVQRHGLVSLPLEAAWEAAQQ